MWRTCQSGAADILSASHERSVHVRVMALPPRRRTLVSSCTSVNEIREQPVKRLSPTLTLRTLQFTKRFSDSGCEWFPRVEPNWAFVQAARAHGPRCSSPLTPDSEDQLHLSTSNCGISILNWNAVSWLLKVMRGDECSRGENCDGLVKSPRRGCARRRPQMLWAASCMQPQTNSTILAPIFSFSLLNAICISATSRAGWRMQR
jgi:hypothetical protein